MGKCYFICIIWCCNQFLLTRHPFNFFQMILDENASTVLSCTTFLGPPPPPQATERNGYYALWVKQQHLNKHLRHKVSCLHRMNSPSSSSKPVKKKSFPSNRLYLVEIKWANMRWARRRQSLHSSANEPVAEDGCPHLTMIAPWRSLTQWLH